METQEITEKLNKIIKNETSIIIPRECPTFDEETANHVRERLELYLKSWVLPKLDEVLNELVL